MLFCVFPVEVLHPRMEAGLVSVVNRKKRLLSSGVGEVTRTVFMGVLYSPAVCLRLIFPLGLLTDLIPVCLFCSCGRLHLPVSPLLVYLGSFLYPRPDKK